MIPVAIKQRLLPFAERLQAFFRTDIRYLTKGGFWLAAGSAANSLSSFILAIAFANLVPKEAYGTYKFILAVAGVFFSFTLTGAAEAVVRAVARGSEGTLRTAFRASLRWSLAVSLAAVAAAAYYGIQGNRVLALALLIIAAAAPILNSANLYSAFLHGRKQFRAATGISIVRNLAPALALLAVVLFVDDPLPLVLAYFAVQTAAAAAAYLYVVKRFAPNNQVDPDATRYGAHLSLMNAIGSLSAYADKILIFHYLGAAPVAVYALALAVPDHIDGLMANVRALALPKFSEKPLAEIRRTFFRKVWLWIAALSAAAAAYLLIAPHLYKLLFPRYPEAIPFTLALGLTIVASGASQLLLAYLTSQQAVRERYVVGTVSPALRLILMFVLVRAYGIWGIVIARVFTKYLSAALAYVLAWRLR